MGSFKVLIRVANPSQSDLYQDLEVLVDTGATFTKLPEDLLHQLNIPQSASKRTLLADGRVITRPSGHARITIQGVSDLVPIIFGPRGEMIFLGATTLEILGFLVDPISQSLIPRDFLEPTES
jgi:clan AA aspartic protease